MKIIYFSIIWSVLFSIVFTITYKLALNSGFLWGPQNEYAIFGGIFILINSIISLFLDFKFTYVNKWFKILSAYTFMCICFLASDNLYGLSTVANLGYGNMAPAEILMRGVVLIICFVIIEKVIVPTYQDKEREVARRISRIISFTTMLLYLIVTFYYYSLLM